MSASLESASSNSSAPAPAGRNVLVCGPNWLGDTIMAMPAVEALKTHTRPASITVLVKPKLTAVWQMHAAADAVLEVPAGTLATLETANALRNQAYDVAYVLPRSFRSALFPFLARIPHRVGLPGYWRDWMLTEVVRPSAQTRNMHQAHEYAAVMESAEQVDDLPPPDLVISSAMRHNAGELLDSLLRTSEPRPAHCAPSWIAVLPGATYGPAKRWPPDSFAAAARKLAEATDCRFAVLGTPRETALCKEVAGMIGQHAFNLAGMTKLPELPALLSLCALVLCNDSGGMHLASAVGTPLVAVFGITDPSKTGPLWGPHKILQDSHLQDRNLARHSTQAAEALAAIDPDMVVRAALGLLRERAGTIGTPQ